ncbi:DUF3810 domain-containing protein [Romboutsia sp. 1001713B170207_170306_H8]|uniref:DUF3810 domain-containing protein n=1 Tax=Romboutsia sp. 1001713B170207_170306_H8 TaxID=2787112 RepID=UPI0008233011|nr:DUF3810 domain-containing protein [Romboutsia sp. 1001713B170207_170306_H8]SCH61480.1 Protein of uncharacterised function (DUF3810) [uncultured Clostridium sp.]
MKKRNKVFIFLLFPISILLNYVASKNPLFIEKYYTQCFNKIIVQVLSNLSGIFPFSIYEVIVYVIIMSIIIFFIYTLHLIINHRSKLIRFIKSSIFNILSLISITYFLFIILWGLNYNKLPLESILIRQYNINNNTSLTRINHDISDLKKLYEFLIEKTNESKNLAVNDKNNIVNYKNTINRAHLGFDAISHIIPNLDGKYSNPKYILSSKLMCYTGITGIYFPFTGESNVNIAIPHTSLSSTILHEMAHQRGYASEDEANFIAYLSAINHPDKDFVYSGYRLALSYTALTLKNIDFNAYTKLNQNLSNEVINDIKYNSKFWSKYSGKINEISDNINNSYLKSNGIKEGTENYSKMVNLLLTYYSLYGFN